MKLLDVNVLVYACLRDAERHEEYRSWLSNALGGSVGTAYSPQSLASAIRIVTHRRIWPAPLSVDQALSFTSAVRSAPTAIPLEPGDGHWEIFSSLCHGAGARGNLVMDAWLAALAIEHGCTLITTDRDFARFPGLKWRHPLPTRSS